MLFLALWYFLFMNYEPLLGSHLALRAGEHLVVLDCFSGMVAGETTLKGPRLLFSLLPGSGEDVGRVRKPTGQGAVPLAAGGISFFLNRFGRNRPGFAVGVDGDEDEAGVGDLGAVFGGAGAAPGFDFDGDGGAPGGDQIGIDGEFVADAHGLQEFHRFHGDGGAAALAAPGGGDAGGHVHLRHQPAAENVAGRVGIGRHGGDADGGFAKTAVRCHVKPPD